MVRSVAVPQHRTRSPASVREHAAEGGRLRRIEFMDLSKTISGKIRQVELRGR